MSDLSTEAEALVRAARGERGLSAEERARVRRRVVRVARGGAFALIVATLAKVTSAKTFGVSTVAWIALATSVTAVGATAVYRLNRTSDAKASMVTAATSRHSIPPSARVPNESAPAKPTVIPQALTSDARIDVTKPRKESKAKSTPAASAETNFARDARLLGDVRAALAAGHPDQALSLLDARQNDSGSSVFAEEKQAATIVTLCQLGRKTEARARAKQFLSKHASSPLAERVRRACPAAD